MANTTKIPRCSGCNVTYSVVDQEWQHAPSCIIARQQHGEPLPDASGEEIEVRIDPMPVPDVLMPVLQAIDQHRREMYALVGLALPETVDAIETNGFDFYIDGYTIGLSGPDKATCTVTRYDGATILLKRKTLTDFLDRRFEPGEDDRSLTG